MKCALVDSDSNVINDWELLALASTLWGILFVIYHVTLPKKSLELSSDGNRKAKFLY